MLDNTEEHQISSNDQSLEEPNSHSGINSILSYTHHSIDSIESPKQQLPAEPWKKPPLPANLFRNSKSRVRKLRVLASRSFRGRRSLSLRFGKKRKANQSKDEEEDSDHSPLIKSCFSEGYYSSLQPSLLTNDNQALPYEPTARTRALTSDSYRHPSERFTSTFTSSANPCPSKEAHLDSSDFEYSDDDISFDQSSTNSSHCHLEKIANISFRSSARRSSHMVADPNLTTTSPFPFDDDPIDTTDDNIEIMTTNSTTRRTLMRCVRCITHNPVSTCMLRIPTVADSLPSIPSHLLNNPKMTFGGLLAACLILDVVFILPGYLFASMITEYGVYASTLTIIWFFGRFVLRMIAFPGSTARLRGEIETEFSKYSIRMLENSAEAMLELATFLVSMDNASIYSHDNGREVHVGAKALQVVGQSYGRFDVIPMWQKVGQYRDRVLGMYHDVLDCLLNQNGEASFNEDASSGPLTDYGNNHIVGDIGKLTNVPPKARSEGAKLFKALANVLDDLERLEICAGSYLNSDMNTIVNNTISPDGIRAARKLFVSATDFADVVSSISSARLSQRSETETDSDDESQDSAIGGKRKSIIWEALDTVKSGAVAALEMFDPPPLKTIFGLDVLRGSFLSRFSGSQQFWIPRPASEGGGSVDAIHIPSSKTHRNLSVGRIEKAVLFCNPNAGLLEVATGLSLIGGNASEPYGDITSWTDFYLDNGFDVILFNYSGYGRSHVGKRKTEDFSGGIFHVLRRLLASFLFGFKASPSSLKADATAAATHVVEKLRVDKFLIHGESIGGMAASAAARNISSKKYLDANSLPVTYPTMLFCDRTFCNLNATAYHLVGSWTGAVIPLLTPFWNTDVAGDFVAARCRKVVAQDAVDAIIHTAASLKKGIATAKELTRNVTKGLGSLGDAPLTYRMADYEDVGVQASTFARFPSSKQVQAPVWPTDKHIELSEAFHFAACVRRIGKVATKIRKKNIFNSRKRSVSYDDEEEGIEITTVFSRDVDGHSEEAEDEEDAILEMIWDALARCDGLTGLPLGVAIKDGYDCTIDWLSGITTLGCQRVALAAESRLKSSQPNHSIPFDEVTIEAKDFDFLYPQSDKAENAMTMPPLPLPYVLQALQDLSDDEHVVKEVQLELEYCIKMLQYIMDRITSKQVVTNSLQIAHFRDTFDDFSTGRFLNLNCGHNNQYSPQERIELISILMEAMENATSLA